VRPDRIAQNFQGLTHCSLIQPWEIRTQDSFSFLPRQKTTTTIFAAPQQQQQQQPIPNTTITNHFYTQQQQKHPTTKTQQ
jgi:hypothetical protein